MSLVNKIKNNLLGLTVASSVLLSSTLFSVPINYKLHKEFNPLFDEAALVVDLGLQDLVATSQGFNDASLDEVAEDVYETQKTLGFNHEDMPEFEPYNFNLSKELSNELWHLTKPYLDGAGPIEKMVWTYYFLDELKGFMDSTEGLTFGDEKIFIGSSPFLRDIIEGHDGAYLRWTIAHELGHSYMAEKNPIHDNFIQEINEDDSLEFLFVQQIYREGIAEYMAYLTAIENGDDELAQQIKEGYGTAILADEPLDDMMTPYIVGFNYVKNCVDSLSKEEAVDLIDTMILNPPTGMDEINDYDSYIFRITGEEDIIIIDEED
ncbi:MAG: hypothetical protein ABIF40_04545 [archaeon]